MRIYTAFMLTAAFFVGAVAGAAAYRHARPPVVDCARCAGAAVDFVKRRMHKDGEP